MADGASAGATAPTELADSTVPPARCYPEKLSGGISVACRQCHVTDAGVSTSAVGAVMVE
eukprot:354449-Chlamydomonas_euryale.AAC.7